VTKQWIRAKITAESTHIHVPSLDIWTKIC
jgi:hypothetical protein